MRPLLLLAVAAAALAVAQAASPGQASACRPARLDRAAFRPVPRRPPPPWRLHRLNRACSAPAPATAAFCRRRRLPPTLTAPMLRRPFSLQTDGDSRRFVLPMDTGMPAKSVWPELVCGRSGRAWWRGFRAPAAGAGAWRSREARAVAPTHLTLQPPHLSLQPLSLVRNPAARAPPCRLVRRASRHAPLSRQPCRPAPWCWWCPSIPW